ncbi:MAG TPA: TonB-dependent receptor, partial [Candidatus Sulfotelmatobacter sp.]|nr:TonB-dependent receptor [Candidatus Sulfotelmatobacter sp.]
MRYSRSLKLFALIVTLIALVTSGVVMFAQETTGGLQGTVKDATGAVVGGAHVVVRGTTLAGEKALDSESTGYYRFANLPPGTYSIEVSAKGFKTVKRQGLAIDTGRLPTVDVTLEVGTTSEVVEVSGQAPVIDVTTNTNQTNVTSDVIDNTPHGYSFQSVIQFAPMARNEPLAGGTGGMGGSAPGSTTSGAPNGYSIGGAADSESTYLVEGQDTENISMGFSNANVPFQFIQEVQVKTSGIEAEHGGALGGVVNVIMKKGSNAYHGSLFGTYEASSMDGSPLATLQYDPLGLTMSGLDNGYQTYQNKKDHYRYAQPGFNVGGPILKDRLWFFLGFAPLYQSTARTVNFGPNICNTASGGDPTSLCPNYGLGNQVFT